jgi:tetratricopeptide (TPR) repeat protein
VACIATKRTNGGGGPKLNPPSLTECASWEWPDLLPTLPTARSHALALPPKEPSHLLLAALPRSSVVLDASAHPQQPSGLARAPPMPPAANQRYDFFLSRRGSVAGVAREVADVLTERGYKVHVQDYDVPIGESFIEMMHEAIKNSRDLVILFTRDYEQSPYTRKEFTSFEAERHQSAEERHVIVLRCEDVPLRGLLAANVYQDLLGIAEPEERKRRIIAAAERQSQAVSPLPRPFIGVPPRKATFTGRVDELAKLDAILMQGRPAAVTQTVAPSAVGRVAIHGLGGVGKTSIAVEYAYRYRNFYSGVWWCPAETRAGLLTSLTALAVTLGAAALDDANVESAARSALNHFAKQRSNWLLIYDNVTNPEHIMDLLPASGARVLITSRWSDWSNLATEVPLDVLTLPESVTYLTIRANRRDEMGAIKLAESLGRLPLALAHAAVLCKRTQMGFVEYAAKLDRLINLAPRNSSTKGSIAWTFQLALAEAAERCPESKKLMLVLALCSPERVPVTLINGVIEDEVESLQALSTLVELSLVTSDPFEDKTPAVSVHRLVQTVARALADAASIEDAGDKLTERFLDAYPHEEQAFEPSSWSLCARLTPHVEHLTSLPVAERAEWGDLLNRIGSYYFGRASYNQAQQTFSRAIAINERAYGQHDPRTALVLNNLALVLWEQGDPNNARLLFERALSIRDEKLGREHLDTAETLNNLAALLKEQGEASIARPLLERALTSYENTLGPEHPWTARSLNNLASVLQAQGDVGGAQQLFERALVLREKILGPGHQDTAMTLTDFAQLLYEQRRLDEARPLYERALAIYEQTLGPEHPWTANSLVGLAQVLQGQGNPAAAEPLFQRALTIRNSVFGAENAETKATAIVTANALDALDRAEEAELLRQQFGVEKGDKRRPIIRSW